MSRFIRLAGLAALLLLFAAPADAQYFGRNKVQYDDFDFKILGTEQFDFYYYPEEKRAVTDAARMGERWYERHTRTFLRDFREKKSIIFYANDADFQQTNITKGNIGQGVGGLTEPLKERVTMPLTGIYSETNHVLGHELVHSFQYDIALNRQDSTRFAINKLPLWLIEGMAEYLSVGSVDPHTSMWLRDAARREDLPTIRQLTRSREYFPYRYGQAYMAYIGGKYGDNAIPEVYRLAGQVGPDSAISYALGITPDSLSEEWKRSVRNTYLPLMEGRTDPMETGRVLLSEEKGGGRINIAPSVSPNGRYVAFLSERNLFSISLFIADAKTGEVVEKLAGPTSSGHFDALRFINSAGSWGPKGKRFAFVAFADGDNEIAIWNSESGEVERYLKVKGVTAMANPAWSPGGDRIAFSGLDGGISDLYVYNLADNTARQLTNDRFADLQPTWSPDGERLAFSTDRGVGGTNFETLAFSKTRLGLIDVTTHEMEKVRRPFGEALHHNPQFSADGESLFFISTQDGFKDVYRLNLASGQTYRVTNLKTGVSGITELAPAMSVARKTGEMMFSVFHNNSYSVVALSEGETRGEPVEPVAQNQTPTAALLPPILPERTGLVDDHLGDELTGLPDASSFSDPRDYEATLQLDRVSPPAVGGGYSSGYGVGVQGGIAFQFSDMLGNHNLTAIGQANGRIKDIGGAVNYVNLGNRFNYGGSVSHVPIRGVVNAERGRGTYERLIRRLYVSSLSGGGRYPFSSTRRAELNAGFLRLGNDYDVQQFNLVTRRRDNVNPEDSRLYDDGRVPNQDAVYLFTGGPAYVGDYSFFGFTSPVRGGRYRFEATGYAGTRNFVQALLDYRRYLFFNPFTFAVRGLHLGNYGVEEARLGRRRTFTNFGSVYLDNPYSPGFVRGYNSRSFDQAECASEEGCPSLARLRGTRFALGSAELRVPLFGTEALGLINFPYLPTELSLFTDAGVAWTSQDYTEFEFSNAAGNRARPVVSSGVSGRFNVLGYIVVEGYWAYPYQRPAKDEGVWGFTLRPGW
jgi:Tol biopolymer transport system component